MSGGRSTLWRTSLCGVVMALTVFSTGCAVDASSDAGDDTEEAQADLIIVDSTVSLGSGKLAEPVSGPQLPPITTQTQSPGGKLDELFEPEPEPWHPRSSRAGSEDSDQVTMDTRSALSDDYK
jgi:hypothetical protein